MRYRIKFSKKEVIRFTGHLDLHRSWERTFRRAVLPLAYSRGYNPRPRIQLASALPLGFTSQAEYLDFWLERSVPVDKIRTSIIAALPPGLEIHSVEPVDLRAPALQTMLIASDFIITFLDPFQAIGEKCSEILKAERLKRERRGKSYDLRPLIIELHSLEDDHNGCQRLFTRLSASEGATGRPEELILALGGEPEASRVHRTCLIFQDMEDQCNQYINEIIPD